MKGWWGRVVVVILIKKRTAVEIIPPSVSTAQVWGFAGVAEAQQRTVKRSINSKWMCILLFYEEMVSLAPWMVVGECGGSPQIFHTFENLFQNFIHIKPFPYRFSPTITKYVLFAGLFRLRMLFLFYKDFLTFLKFHSHGKKAFHSPLEKSKQVM